jgi:hypothetical protein
MEDNERNELAIIAGKLELIHQEFETLNTWLHLISDSLVKLTTIHMLKSMEWRFGTVVESNRK